MLPMLISNIIQASVSVKRLGTFLKNEELDPNIVDWKLEPAGGTLLHANITLSSLQLLFDNIYIEGEAAVTLSDSTFSWDSEDSDRATLKKYDCVIV